MISIIAAMDSKNGIGKGNKIPWHIKEDLIHLKNLTKDKVVILGRKTYESMASYYNKSGRPMPGKLYVVVTHDKNYSPDRDNAIIANSLEEALSKSPNEDKFITGGGQIFKEALEKNLVDKLYLTIVEGDFDCDTFFPEYKNFKVISEQKGESPEFNYKFLTLIK